MRVMRRRCAAARFTLSVLTMLGGAALSAQSPPTCIPGTQQSFSSTGSLETYSVPASAAALYMVADGASGGAAGGTVGGHGAHVQAEVPVTGPATLSVVVGGAGGDVSDAGAGGGGGSFVYAGGNALVAAGGGAGSHVAGQTGGDAQLGPNGGAFPGFYGGGAGGRGGGGGGAGWGTDDAGAGGGGFLGAGTDGCCMDHGGGGHRVSSPGDAGGGAGGSPAGGVGGFGGGGGGGGGASGGYAGGSGGGGGYSGGGGGNTCGGCWGGGGGSFVAGNATYSALSVLTSTGPGSVTICVSQTVTPDLTVAKQHLGSFAQGDAGRQYTIIVTNAGPAPTSAAVTVTDVLPAGLIATDVGGPGWSSCTATPVVGPGTLSCSRSDPLQAGQSYPAITLTVSVTSDAPPSVTNSARLSGGGQADDPTTILPAQPPLCVPDGSALCLFGGRFRVTATFDAGGGAAGSAHAAPLTDDTGYFWFFSEANVEALVKVIDGCGMGGHYWVFAGGLTDVEVVLTVTDTLTQTAKMYTNPPHTAFQPIQDTAAFATCP
jgi:uncharacterized repeat protein (TIGR01451 family)